MPRFRGAAYNVYRKNRDRVVRGDLLQLATDERVTVMVLGEAGPPVDAGVDAAVRRLGWRQYHPVGSDRITWDPDTWEAIADGSCRRVHKRGPAPWLPARYLLDQPLRHRPSGTDHVFVGTHVTAGYVPEDKPHDEWRDYAARRHMLAAVQLTARLTARWDAPGQYVHLWGDLNARPGDDGEWWYPSRILASLYVPDTQRRSLDWMLHTWASHDAGLRQLSRYSLGEADGMDSDHRAHVKVCRVPRLS